MKLRCPTLTLIAALSLCSCGEGPARPHSPTPNLPTADPSVPPAHAIPTVEETPVPIGLAPRGNTPNLSGGPLFSNAGAFSLTGAAFAGTASFTAAPVIDWQSNVGPATLGTGEWQSIQVAGTTYATSTAEAMAGVMPDDQGTDYLLLSAFTEEIDPATGVTIGTVMHVMVLASDFAVGGSVNLDGTDRLAIFARGDISLPEPQIAAAAVTGTVTFSAGGLAVGDLITATLGGDFAEFTWPTSPPPPTGGGSLTPGSYTLTFDPNVQVWCDGTLAGQEPTFAQITAASIGFGNGPVTLAAAATAGSFDISGAPITSGFGVPALTLDPMPDAPPGVVGNFVNGSGSGPAGTTFAGTYLMLDGSTATMTAAAGWAGAGYMTAAQDGFCSVDFLVELGP